RQRQRGTAAHNTVVVDDENSSEVWAGFRVARRARADLREARRTEQSILIEASHDGYRRLPGRVLHTRRWEIDRESLRIEDRVAGRFRSAEARFHLHPSVSATLVAPFDVALHWPGGSVKAFFEGASSVDVRRSTWHPGFGIVVPNTVVVARLASPTLVSRWSWGSACTS